MRSSVEETAFRAFQLAYFIHPHSDTAFGITLEAFSSLPAHLKPQKKRAYYRLKGRIAGGFSVKARTKITLDVSQMLQTLIYEYSRRIERKQEETILSNTSLAEPNHVIREEDWLIRFVKHLIFITVTKSAFYVTLGIGRIAFNYSTEETAEIYDVLIQDQNCRKDSPYFRKRKNEMLMKSLKERFGRVLQTHVVARGEERLRVRPDSREFLSLVNECLEMFTLWNTDCVLPQSFDPTNEIIADLCSVDNDPDKEHSVEALRMHTVIHPLCFARLVNALAFASPGQRLEVPIFFVDHSDGRPGTNRSNGSPGGPDRRNPPLLSDSQLEQIQRVVQSQSKRRKRARPETVSVMVDGVDCASARLDDAPLHLRVDEDSRLIEIKDHDVEGDLLLGSLLLDRRELLSSLPSRSYRLRLAGRRELLVTLSPLLDEGGEFEGADIELTLRGVRSLAAFRSVAAGMREQMLLVHQRPILAIASLSLLLAALVVGVILWRRHAVPSDYVAQVQSQPSPSSTGLPSPNSGRGETASQQPSDRQSSPEGHADQSASPNTPNHQKSDEGARALSAEIRMELSAVRKIYVEEDSGGLNSALRDTFIKTINESGKLRTTDESNADAFLAWEVRTVRAAKRIEVRLLNRTGTILWSSSRTVSIAGNETFTAQTMVRGMIATIPR